MDRAQPLPKTFYTVLFALSFTHLLNDTIQSLIPAMYPIVKTSIGLSFSQIGLITLTFQLCASILQPIVGLYTDKKPQPYALAIGMFISMMGLLALAYASSFAEVLVAVGLVGTGSAIFHPEASRMAFLASGNKPGTGQSLFQVGGNTGSSLGPLLAASIIVPFGQHALAWFAGLAVLAICIMIQLSKWSFRYQGSQTKNKAQGQLIHKHNLTRHQVIFSIIILLLLIFSKYIYMTSLTSYYTFYLMDQFGVSVTESQYYLFLFLFAIAAGTFIGGPVGDRIGRKYVIWISILGVAPFTLALPYVNLLWTAIFSACIGVILSSAFSAILIYAQELIPGKVGLVAGLFFGFAFGIAGIGSALLGNLADHTSIYYIFQICAFLPLIGILTAFLPNIEKQKSKTL
jgi:FSR family fosmidomycin resistance protein-like MFS transporter